MLLSLYMYSWSFIYICIFIAGVGNTEEQHWFHSACQPACLFFGQASSGWAACGGPKKSCASVLAHIHHSVI